MHGNTPATLAGAHVLDTKALVALIAQQHPLLIDVAEAPKQPASTAPDMPWMPTHRTIPGAVWLVEGGSGTPDPAFAEAFKARFDALTAHRTEAPIVAFCHPHCWGSWNTAKRLVQIGYKHVYWYRDGVEGWEQSGHETKVAKPDAEWMKTAPLDKPASKRQREGMK